MFNFFFLGLIYWLPPFVSLSFKPSLFLRNSDLWVETDFSHLLVQSAGCTAAGSQDIFRNTTLDPFLCTNLVASRAIDQTGGANT